MDITRASHPNSEKEFSAPINYYLMLELANSLSALSVFSRIDFYEIQGRVYFGEITFYPSSGLEKFVPDKWDIKLGEWLELPLD